MNPRDTTLDTDATLNLPPASAKIWQLAAPNYTDQWQRFRGLLTIMRTIGTLGLIYVAYEVVTGAISDVSDAGLDGPIHFPGGIAFLVSLPFLIIFGMSLFPSIFSKIITGITRTWSIVWRAVGLSALLDGIAALVTAVIPHALRTRFNAGIDRVLRGFLPSETGQLDPVISGLLPQHRFPWLYQSLPVDLDISPVIDGRLPNGSMPHYLARRIVSRGLVMAAAKKAVAPILTIVVCLIVLNILDIFPASINAARMAIYNHHERSIMSENADIQAQNQTAEADYQAAIAGQQEANTKSMMGYQAEQSDNAAKENAYRQAAAAWMQQRAGYIDHVQNHDAQYIGAYQNWLRAGKTGPQPVMVTSLPPPPVHPVLTAPTAPGMVQGNVAQPVLKNPVADTWTQPAQLTALSLHGLFVLDIFGLAICLLILNAVTKANVRRAEEIVGYKYFQATKTGMIGWDDKAADRRIFNETYEKATGLTQVYLKEKPIFNIGTATGHMAFSGAYSGPPAGTPVCLDGEAIFTNILTLGGTGTGKTSAVLTPMAKQILRSKTPLYGILMIDPKGVFWRVLERLAAEAGRGDDMLVIGPDHMQPSAIAGLDPQAIGPIVKSLMAQMGDQSGTPFFRDMAALVLSHSAVVAHVLGHYDLKSIYQISSLPNVLTAAVMGLDKIDRERLAMYPCLGESVNFLMKQWAVLANETKGSVRGVIANLLDAACADETLTGFVGAGFPSEILAYAYQSGHTANDVADSVTGDVTGDDSLTSLAFDGKIIITAMSSTSGGLAGRLVLMCLKSSFYRAAKVREERMGSAHCQANPVYVLCDECQLVVSGGDGLSDSEFWNVSRSAGIAGLFLTQGLAALEQTLGKDAMNNLVQQFRSKIFLTTEDELTHNLIIHLAGQHKRFPVMEPGQFEHIPAWEAANGQAFVGDAIEEQERAVRFVARANAKDIFEIQSNFDREMSIRPIYSARYYREPIAGNQGGGPSMMEWNRQEMLKAEDLNRQFLSAGNGLQPAMSVPTIINMGRFHAYVHIQRAGMARSDIITLNHQF